MYSEPALNWFHLIAVCTRNVLAVTTAELPNIQQAVIAVISLVCSTIAMVVHGSCVMVSCIWMIS